MANTINGFVVIQIGSDPSGRITLTPADVTNAGASFNPKAALANLHVQYLADSLDDAATLGTLGSAVGGIGKLIEDAFNLGTGALGDNDPFKLFNNAIGSVASALGVSSAFQTLQSDIANVVVKITQITIINPPNTFTFGIGFDFSNVASLNALPVKLKALSVTFSHTKS